MAYLDHIDPGNSGGSVQIPDTRVSVSFKPVIYPCSICSMIFKDQESLSDHRISEHPIKRPMLLIKGEPLRKDEITVRSAMAAADIEFSDVDEIYVNDQKVNSHSKLKEWLCSATPLSFQLKLVNRNFPVECRWSIDIAEEQELDAVDEQFYSAFGNGLEISQSFSLFNERVAGFSSAARNYAAGLSCYVAAVITKDQLAGATLAYEKYGHKLGEAMDILVDYPSRRLASAIFSIAEFMQNNFTLQRADSSLPKLKATKQFFNSGRFYPVDDKKQLSNAIPIDTVTEVIVDFCALKKSERKSRISDMTTLLKSSSVGKRDSIKSIFILWCLYREWNDLHQADHLRGKLIHNTYFGGLIEMIEEV